jgi:hypothetical protein
MNYILQVLSSLFSFQRYKEKQGLDPLQPLNGIVRSQLLIFIKS